MDSKTVKYWPITFGSPLEFFLDRDKWELTVVGLPFGSIPSVTAMGAIFPLEAMQELSRFLKAVEDDLGRPIESLAKPNSVQ